MSDAWYTWRLFAIVTFNQQAMRSRALVRIEYINKTWQTSQLASAWHIWNERINRQKRIVAITCRFMGMKHQRSLAVAFGLWRLQTVISWGQIFQHEIMLTRMYRNFASLHSRQTAAAWRAWTHLVACLLYTSPSPRDRQKSRMPSSA